VRARPTPLTTTPAGRSLYSPAHHPLRSGASTSPSLSLALCARHAMAPATATAAFTSLLPAGASRLPSAAAAAGAAASFVRLPRHPTGWAGASLAAPRTARRRAPWVAYATAATEKSIYDYTVKVTRFLPLRFLLARVAMAPQLRR